MTSKVIIGAGDHAAELFHHLDEYGDSSELLAFAVDNPVRDVTYLGKPIVDIDLFNNCEYSLFGKVPSFIVGIGDVGIRGKIYRKLKMVGWDFFNIVDESVKLNRQGFIGEGVYIAKGCVLTCNIKIGNNVIVNIGSTISHNCCIGDNVNISPGCHVAGNVIIEDDVFIGTGVSIIPGVRIGKGAFVAAGACVVQDVVPYTLVAGVPAKLKKYL